MSKNGVAELMPAPLITMSMRPDFFQDRVAQSLQLRLARGLGGVNQPVPSRDAILASRAAAFFLGTPDQYDLSPRAGQPLGHGAAEFPRAADHDGDLAGEVEQGVEVIGGFMTGAWDGTKAVAITFCPA